MSTPNQLVDEAFSNANNYANNALTQLTTFTNALGAAVYTAPTFDLTWTTIDPPSTIAIPSAPDITDTFEWDVGSVPADLTDTPTEVVIDDFTEVAPVLDFGDKPVLDFGVRPVVPEIASVVVPDAPVIDAVSAPSYLSLTTPTFAGVDLHASFLANLETVPTLDLVAPTPYTYSPGANYASDLLAAIKAKLLERANGGSGLTAAVEQAIWDRVRSREAKNAQAAINDVSRQSEALGYQFPAGITAAQLRQAQQTYYDALSTANRDIGIKQADLEQANLKDTIAAGIDLEGKLIDYSYRLEELAYQSAKTVAENAVGVYNAQVDQFKAIVAGYQAYAQAYQSLIDGEKLKIEEYRGALQGEQTKAEVNRTLVEEYKAAIDAGMSLVKIYEAQVGGAKALIELEGAKLAAVGEEIKAYVAGVNGETARVEAYKAGVQGELGKVEVYRAQASAFSAKSQAQGEKARANLSYFQALVDNKRGEWDGYRARVTGEAERFRGLAAKSGAILDGFRLTLAAAQASVEQDVKRWEIGIKQYEAQANYSLSVAKMNTEVIQANRQATLEAAKVGAQTFAQLTASAYSMIHASAGVAASASTSVSYGYTNQTSSAPASVTAI
jgi:hypothetical protein